MLKLPLAVEIADTILEAARLRHTLDINESAERLSQRHPRAMASKCDIAEILQFEGQAVGLTVRGGLQQVC